MANESIESTARTALSELIEVSPQVEFAVVARRDGTPIVGQRRAGGDASDIASKFSGVLVRVLAHAERSRKELGREPVTQCEVAISEGSLFLVADANLVVAAVTSTEPTVGLVFYDLKAALRAVREAGAASSNGAATNPSPSTIESSTGADV